VGATPVLQSLKADLSANLSAADVVTQIEKCSQALDALSNLSNPDTYLAVWYAPYQDQVYWSDYPVNVYFYGENSLAAPPPQGASNYCYNAQVPGQDPAAPEGQVYSYILAFPAFLEALCIWLTAAKALAPSTFVDDYGGSVLTPAWQFMKDQHDKIVNEGITDLSPMPYIGSAPPGGFMPGLGPVSIFPYATDDGAAPFYGGPVGTSDPIWAPAGSGLPAPSPVAWTGSMLANWWPSYPDGRGSLTGVGASNVLLSSGGFIRPADGRATGIEYGTVEVFSGYSVVGVYVLDFGVGDGMLDPDSTDLAAYTKFQIRLMETRREVYIGVGLLGVWNTINTLGAIIGQAPLARPNQADWSFRQISSVVGLNSLRGIREFITSTPPADTPPPAGFLLPFREVLEVLPKAPSYSW
jgi:hypothetical protein